MAESISQTLTRRPWEKKLAEINKTQQALASIEETVGETTNSSIEEPVTINTGVGKGGIVIPPEIDALIDNKMYRNKFKGLIKRGHLGVLRELVEVAHTKDKPSHWFARATSKANWERTLKFVEKLRQVARLAEEVMNRIKVPTDSAGAVFKACWNLKSSAVRHAITAAETGKDPFKYFCWLSYKLGKGQTTVA